MELISTFLICLPLVFLVTLFIGIVKKNKRLWITSLIFFVVITLAECTLFIANSKTNSTIIQKTHSID